MPDDFNLAGSVWDLNAIVGLRECQVIPKLVVRTSLLLSRQTKVSSFCGIHWESLFFFFKNKDKI